MCTDWASALTVWGSDVRFRTTVLVNLTVRYTLVQPPSVAGRQGMLHSGRRSLYEKCKKESMQLGYASWRSQPLGPLNADHSADSEHPDSLIETWAHL